MSFSILGVGDILWDLLPSGPQLGGASANFAIHSAALGAKAGLISRVGNDSNGRAVFGLLESRGVSTAAIQVDSSAPTGTVIVSLSADGLPSYTIRENVAWDNLLVTPEAEAAMSAADAICFGSHTQRNERSRASIRRLVSIAPKGTLRLFDANLRADYYSREVMERSLRLASALKLNADELIVLSGIFGLSSPARNQIESLARKFDLDVVALTRGPQGSLLFQGGQWSDCAPAPVAVADTVGAGDAFAAALVLGLLHRMKLDQINQLATGVARFVCSCSGATPPLPAKFSEMFCIEKSTRQIEKLKMFSGHILPA